MEMPFTIDEITIIKLFCGDEKNRDKTIAKIRASIPNTEEVEIKEIMESVIRKINAMTKDKFSELDLSMAIDHDE